MDDLTIVGGEFLDADIPEDKKYLLKYFNTPIQEQFLRYFLFFGHYKKFVENTGVYCAPHYLKTLRRRCEWLVNQMTLARKNMDLELISKIQSGKIPITHI